MLKFRCKLLSDVILNQKAATEGPNKTLDFIPGSCFLGIVASQLYPKNEDKDIDKNEYSKKIEKAMELFHSGKVRFGDAHPSQNGVRGLRIPASMFYPKLSKVTDGEIYIHHLIPNLEVETLTKKQLKQCRSGFYTFSEKKATEVKTDTNFAIKSAYDKEKRRSKDEQMYGYESLQKGLVLYFEVQIDNDDLEADIIKALVGKRRVGRSRTAQYGLVKIESLPTKDEQEYKDSETTQTITYVKDKEGKEVKCVTVYADSRLIFLDEYGLPTFKPTEEQLGLPKDSNILWEKSQIRTFQYSPWNYQRQCFDADRCGIEKGSVFVVDVSKCGNLSLKSQYVGSFKNEGFGKVIYNPDFLRANEKGIALCQVKRQEVDKREKPDKEKMKEQVEKEVENLRKGTVLLQYLAQQKQEEQLECDVYAKVNEWVDKNWKAFRGESFASQWGAIRSIAMKYRKLDDLKNELFDKTALKNGKPIHNAYLTHGVAADKWRERGRLVLFRGFFDGLTDENAQMAIVNLAAEMAKKCKKEDK